MAAGAEVDRTLAEWLIVSLILFSLLVEVVLHRLERWVIHKHAHLTSVLRNLYRELMTLGTVSVGFILYVFIAEPSANVKFTFEVAHVFIFLFALFHTVVVLASVMISMRLSARWKRLETVDLAAYLALKEEYALLGAQLERRGAAWWRYCAWWFPRPGRLLRYWALHEAMAFHDTRFQFIYFRKLAPDFNFAAFLRKIKSATFIELVEIHWSNFMFFLAVVLADLARGASRASLGASFDPAFLIAQSALNMLAATALALKIQRVYWKMTKNPATYYGEEGSDSEPGPGGPLWKEDGRAEGAKLVDSSSPVSPPLEDPGPLTQMSAGGIRRQQPLYAHMAYVPPYPIGRSPFPDADRPLAQLPPPSPSSVRAVRRQPAEATSQPATKRSENSESVSTRWQQSQKSEVARLDLGRIERDTLEARLQNADRVLSARSQTRMDELRQRGERGRRRASLAENAEELEAARRAQPRTRYPAWVVQLAPRLGRVASPAERLFWFGSHRFFMMCVEWTLFFATVNLATALAKIGFDAKELRAAAAEFGSQRGAPRALAGTAARAPPKGVAPGAGVPMDSFVLLLVALGVAVVALVYVLMRTAGIMKKYIFVLNNANMLQEDMTIQAIHTIRLQALVSGEAAQTDAVQGNIEEEEMSAHKRRVMSDYLEAEHERGYMPGVASSPLADIISVDSPVETGENVTKASSLE